ncbi:sugar phosphate isomerase/epimerase family protein [Microbacterium deminutum]|uniref:Sugar phosphate isomerase/epimerase n=1 Tax=Microbacterium deminutum TaxID=344164 RepID=A0ABN2QTM5_9MICO
MTDSGTPSALDLACHVNVFVADASPGPFGDALAEMAAAGFSRVVLPPLDPSTVDAAALRRSLAEHGLAPITIAGGLTAGADVGSSDADERMAGAARLRDVVDLTAAVGGDQMNGVPYGVFGHPRTATPSEVFERAALEVGAVADYAHERGITMTFEVLNRYETSVVNTAARAVEFVALSGSEHLRIHLDTFHMAIEETDMAEAIRISLPKLAYLELGQSGRGPLSTGVVDLVDVVTRALDLGYDGRIGIEAFSRSILSPEVGDMLAIWREPYDDGAVLAADAMRVIQRGWAQSTVGRRAQRLTRSSAI